MTQSFTSTWQMTTLGELTSPKQWPILSSVDLELSGFPVYGANGRIGYSSKLTHSEPVLLVGCRGTCGSVYLTDGPTYATGNAMALDSPDLNRVDLGFLAHWLSFRGFKDVTSGSSQPQITRQNIVRVNVPLPSIVEQRRIAAILDHANALRVKRREALTHLDTLTQSIFLDMFGEPIRNTRGWPVANLSSLVATGDRINYGVIQPGEDVSDGIPLIRVGDLVGEGIRIGPLKRISPEIEAAYSRSRIRGNEILVSCVGSIGVIALVDPRVIGFNIARAVARVPIDNPNLRRYLASYLASKGVQRYFTDELRTVAQPTLNIKQLGETVVMLPPNGLQERFAAHVARARSARSGADRQLRALDLLFLSLQQRAFSGQL